MLEQIRPVVVNEVDEQAFDMGAVLILICHDHDFTVAQLFHTLWVIIFLFVLQSENFDDVVDFSILHDLSKKKRNGSQKIIPFASFCQQEIT